MRRSIFGYFCRRCFVSFIKLSFSGVVKLQEDYRAWCLGDSRAGYESVEKDQLSNRAFPSLSVSVLLKGLYSSGSFNFQNSGRQEIMGKSGRLRTVGLSCHTHFFSDEQSIASRMDNTRVMKILQLKTSGGSSSNTFMKIMIREFECTNSIR